MYSSLEVQDPIAYNDFDISDEAIAKCFDIYTLNPDTILYRLHEMKRIPEFEALFKNKRVVRLVLLQNKAKLRLEHLQKLKIKCTTMNSLCASDIVFEKFALEGNDHSRGSDLINYLASELDTLGGDVRKLLSYNPHWCHVSLTAVQNTLSYLLRNHFSKEEIRKIPVILLYQRYKINDALEEIKRHSEINYFDLSKRQIINLCLYFIEKKHHFSGDGVWDNNCMVENKAENTAVSPNDLTSTDVKELHLY